MTNPSVKSESVQGPRPFESAGFDAHRGSVDYALRTMQQSLVQLSLMADAKANIMITVCSIVISVSVTQLHRPAMFWPLLALGAFTAVALVAALLCVLPARRKPERVGGAVDSRADSFNPLFFQHFRHLSLDEFQRELDARFGTWPELQRALARDIHATGQVVGATKYRLLRVSYLAFIAGLVGGAAIAIGQALPR